MNRLLADVELEDLREVHGQGGCELSCCAALVLECMLVWLTERSGLL